MATASKWQNSQCQGAPTGPKWTNLCTKLIVDLTDLMHQDIWINPPAYNRAKINVQAYTWVHWMDIKGIYLAATKSRSVVLLFWSQGKESGGAEGSVSLQWQWACLYLDCGNGFTDLHLPKLPTLCTSRGGSLFK